MIKFLKQRSFYYGLAEVGPASIDLFLKVHLLIYFNQIHGLPAAYASLAIGLSVVWDALVDPWIGRLSDLYYYKYKSRKNLLYFSTFGIAFFFFLLWVSHSNSMWVGVFLLFLFSSLLNSAISFFSVPYFATANDLESDNEKRKYWIGWRMFFFNLGYLLGLAVPAFFLTRHAESDRATAYFKTVLFFCVLTVCVSFFSIKKVFKSTDLLEQKNDELKLSDAKDVSWTDLFKDKIFLQLVAAFFVVNCGLGLNSSLALYYYKTYLNLTESQTHMILIGFLLIFTASIPFWIKLTKIFNKKKLIIFSASSLGLVSILSFPNYKGSPFWLIFLFASGVSGILVGVNVVLEIFQSDFLKRKEIELKKSVSGQYLGLWKMFAKISRGVAIVLAGPIVDISKENPALLANFFGWAVGLFFILSALIMSISISEKSE